MTVFYKIMDSLPAVPAALVNTALQRSNDFAKLSVTERNQQQINPSFLQGRIITRDSQFVMSRPTPRADIRDEFENWVNKNISDEWSEIGVSLSLPPDDGQPSDFLGPHSDKSRAYVLIYLIEQSNPDQYTVWYQDQGKGLYRKRTTAALNFDTLHELDRICIPMHTWVYINANILHSAENVHGSRTSIQISFDVDPFGVFVN